ncbi:LysR family transcriptional regulator [Phenylobacterium sp. 20VBR1]|uniref:LysR family transcriptional regulator n=1 Tax=Phenylobacterium glaciei TaxID=2803784 RepID=A0A941CZB8_9CAUL|nr:LysR family transcriptional regulator [Phenylobacterium glaciei]MBR7618629.1 LysR family transcriptional regulator [Phenylobacterium glaciei]
MSGLALNELNAMAAVAAHRSFRAAASELAVSPSALSHAIASMERRLGVRLFNRTTRSVSLTEAGEQFLARVQPALREIADAVESVNRFRDTPTGLLRLNASEGAAERVLPIVLDFMAAYPDMRVDMVSEGRMVDIVAEGFDAGLRLGETAPQEMIALSLGVQEAMIVVGSPAYLTRRGAPKVPADLFAHECIRARLPSGTILRWEFARQGEETRLDPPGRLVLGSPDLSLQAARGGAGLAFVNCRSASKDLASGTLIQVLADWTPPFPGIALYYPRQRLPSAGLRAFIDCFQAARLR